MPHVQPHVAPSATASSFVPARTDAQERGKALLLGGLVAECPLQKDLHCSSPAGIAHAVLFERESAASTSNLELVPANTPRYVQGRGATGLLVEYSSRGITNLLQPCSASAEDPACGFAAEGDGRLDRTKGVQGHFAVRLTSASGRGTLSTSMVRIPASGSHTTATFSAYVFAARDASFYVSAWRSSQEVARLTARGLGKWQRVQVSFPVPAARSTARFRFGMYKPGRLRIDACMLEAHHGYGRRKTASSWYPGQATRSSEVAALPFDLSSTAGTVAVRLRLLGRMGWRRLLSIGRNGIWKPELALDLRNDQMLRVMVKGKSTRYLPGAEELANGKWHDVTVTWDSTGIAAYVDGTAVWRRDHASLPSVLGPIALGSDARSPAQHVIGADAVFNDLRVWKRALPSTQIRLLSAFTQPVVPNKSLELSDHEPLKVFARDARTVRWPIQMENHTPQAIRHVVFDYGVDNLWHATRVLKRLDKQQAVRVALPWHPALFEPGMYTFHVRAAVEGTIRTIRRRIQIVRSRDPSTNVQILDWSGTQGARALGCTASWAWSNIDGPRPSDVDRLTQNGLRTLLRVDLSGKSVNLEDYFVDSDGRRTRVDQRAPAPLADLASKSGRLATRVEAYPDVSDVIINSEREWSWHPDFRRETRKLVRKRFGLDLAKWVAPDRRKASRALLPYGRLSISAVHYSLPQRGVVAENEPLYAFERWWHSGQVGNEVFLDDFVAHRIRARAPWVRTIVEPALRRPPVRAFHSQDLLESWFYFSNPARSVWVQEALAAASRGTGARTSCMPELVLRPGAAAPFAGLPTPDMYTETMWHCIARPLAAVTYWNLAGAIEPTARPDTVSQSKLLKQLGGSGDWAAVSRHVRRTGDSRSEPFLFVPGLDRAVRDMDEDVVRPLGALLPRWKNRPRRLAVYVSFAGEIFSRVRWPSRDPLSKLMTTLGVPFDIIYDQDFERNPEVLHDYDAVVVPQASIVPQAAFKALSRFLTRGGAVFVNADFKAVLPGAHRVKLPRGDAAARASVRSDIVAGLDLEASTRVRHVYWNLLEAKGANYLAIVNGRRRRGRFYGRFGKVREGGVATSATFRVARDLGHVAYDLLTGKRLVLTRTSIGMRLQVNLAAGGGRILVLLPRRIARFAFVQSSAKAAQRGAVLQLSATLRDPNGATVPGIIPVRVEVTGPSTTETFYSACVDGTWSAGIPIAVNARAGRYHVRIREAASGRTAVMNFQLPDR